MSEPVWNERLMTRDRALELAGRWPLVVVYYPGAAAIGFHCAREPHDGSRKGCFQEVHRVNGGYRTCVEDLLAAVLRHGVTAHETVTGRWQSPPEGGDAA